MRGRPARCKESDSRAAASPMILIHLISAADRTTSLSSSSREAGRCALINSACLTILRKRSSSDLTGRRPRLPPRLQRRPPGRRRPSGTHPAGHRPSRPSEPRPAPGPGPGPGPETLLPLPHGTPAQRPVRELPVKVHDHRAILCGWKQRVTAPGAGISTAGPPARRPLRRYPSGLIPHFRHRRGVPDGTGAAICLRWPSTRLRVRFRGEFGEERVERGFGRTDHRPTRSKIVEGLVEEPRGLRIRLVNPLVRFRNRIREIGLSAGCAGQIIDHA